MLRKRKNELAMTAQKAKRRDCFGSEKNDLAVTNKGAVASEAKQSEIASPDEQTRLAMTGERAKKQARNDQERGEKTGSQ